MKNNFLPDRPQLRRLIRIAEIIVVSILAVYATLTWRELKILRGKQPLTVKITPARGI